MWRYVDVEMWRCGCGDVDMWRCVYVVIRMCGKCGCGDVEMWRCGCMELRMWRCVDVEMWRYEDVEIWRFGVIAAAKLFLWLVEVLRYKTKKFSVNVIESCLF